MEKLRVGKGSFIVLLAVFALLSASIGACAPAAIPETGTAVIDIQMTDSAVTVPEQVNSGVVTLNIQNTGQAPRSLILGRLKPDVTFEQFMATFEQNDIEAVALVTLKGGRATGPGETQQLIVDLDDGIYVTLGFPQSEAAPVFGTFQVGGGETSQATAPEASVMVNLSDFTFDLPNQIPAGEQTWELRNTGDQWHEMALFKLEEGMTEEELVAMLQSEQQPQGPPPFTDAGFFGPASNGESFWVPINLEPGTYTAICFLPNVLNLSSGESHMQKGMVKTFEVTGP